jgi:hypothetical protein
LSCDFLLRLGPILISSLLAEIERDGGRGREGGLAEDVAAAAEVEAVAVRGDLGLFCGELKSARDGRAADGGGNVFCGEYNGTSFGAISSAVIVGDAVTGMALVLLKLIPGSEDDFCGGRG